MNLFNIFFFGILFFYNIPYVSSLNNEKYFNIIKEDKITKKIVKNNLYKICTKKICLYYYGVPNKKSTFGIGSSDAFGAT